MHGSDALITAARRELSNEQTRGQREQDTQEQYNVYEEVTDAFNERLSGGEEGSQSEEDIIKEVDVNVGTEKRTAKTRKEEAIMIKSKQT